MSDDRPSRRQVLAATGTAILGGVAGCSGASDSTPSEAPADAEPMIPALASTDGTGTPIRGNFDAQLTVEVFEDYACPHCRTYTLDVAPDVYAAFTMNGRVRYEFHDLPIPVADPASWQAASAAREVLASQGNREFWAYNRLLFENQDSLGPETYASLAGEVGADPDAVRTAAVEERYRAAVEADRQRAVDMGAEGTPAVFVDGDPVQPTFDAIRAAIEG